MTPAPAADKDPYVGPRPFRPEEHDRFFGRRWETGQVTDLLLAERIVLLFSPSGAGKTSLIEAGVRKALEDEGLAVLPLARVNAPPAAALAAGANRYLASTLAAWDKPLAEELRQPEEKFAGLDVGAYLQERRRRVQARRREVIVLDQLEEILTLDPFDVEADRARLEWFAAIGAALQADRGLWALFSMREDYLGQLGQYFEEIPSGLAIRFRLDVLQKPAAVEAIRQPVAKFAAPDGRPVVFTEPAARWIAEEIAKVQVQQGGERGEVAGRYVEPVQLQVVCDRLWKGMRWAELSSVDGAAAIEETYVKTYAQIPDALGDYYDERVATIAAGDPTAEGRIRRWFDRYLITERLTRGQVRAGAEEETLQLSEPVLTDLVNAHLVRRDVRHDSVWYELAHDRLVEPVRARNRAWRAVNMSAFERLAADWDDRGQPDDLLLRGKVLKEAEVWAAAHRQELELTEETFLNRSVARRAAEQARETRLLRLGLAGAAVIVAIFLGLAVFAYNQSEKARNAEATAEALRRTAEAEAMSVGLTDRSRQLAAQSQAQLAAGDVTGALLLAVQASEVADTVEARSALLAALASSPHLSRILRDQNARVDSIAVSSDRTILATGGDDGSIWVRKVADGTVLCGLLVDSATASAVTSLAFSPVDGNRLVSGTANGVIHFWNVATCREDLSVIPAHHKSINDLAFSADGAMLASASMDETVRLWNIETQDEGVPPLLQFGSPITSIAFHPDRRELAFSGSGGFGLISLSPDAQTTYPRMDDRYGQVWSVDFGPHGDWLLLAAGPNAGIQTVVLWDTIGETQAGEYRVCEGQHGLSAAISPDGQWIALGQIDGRVRLWPREPSSSAVTRGTPTASSAAPRRSASPPSTNSTGCGIELLGHTNKVSALVFATNDSHDPILFSASWDGTAIEWRPAVRQPLATELGRHTDDISSVAFSVNGETVAAGDGNGNVILWSVAGNERSDFPRAHTAGNSIVAVDFNPNGNTLASASSDGTIVLWDLVKKDRIGDPLKAHQVRIRDISFNADGTILASFGPDTVFLWDVHDDGLTRRELPSLPQGDLQGVESITFSPTDPDLLAIGHDDGTITLWDVQTGGTWAEPLQGQNGVITALAFEPEGRMLASVICVASAESSACVQSEIQFWDVENGEPIGEPLQSNQREVHAIAFSADGRLLASAGDDATIVLWDTVSRTPIIPSLIGHDDKVTSVAFNPGAATLASGSFDKTVILWDVDLGSWQSRACRLIDEEGTDVTSCAIPMSFDDEDRATPVAANPT